MRYLSALIPYDPDKTIEYSKEDAGYHIYDNILRKKYDIMSHIYRTDKIVKNSYRKMVIISHPFEIIHRYVTSSFIPDFPKMKMTNAYMKMWEFLEWADKENYLHVPKSKLTMFDIAAAPGMFIIATENYLRINYPNTKLDWQACSLEGGTALTDTYDLFKNNPDRYRPCDVLNKSDIENCMSTGKYYLVTGDIGIYHEDNYDKLQEEVQLDIEWGQMILSINLVEKGGIMFLKMYSLVTLESIYLLDTLHKYFEYVFITKPYCTRIFNDECYIICINRNDKDCSSEPFSRPPISNYKSPNIDIVRSFEYARLELKYRMVNFIKLIFEHGGHELTVESFKNNNTYKIYFDEFSKLFNTFEKFDFIKIWNLNE